MGDSASGMLVYGIDIGNVETYGTLGPKPEGAEEWAPPDVDWLIDEEVEEPTEDLGTFARQLIHTLAQRSGWTGKGDKDGENAAEYVREDLGVEVVTWGHSEYERWILAPVGERFQLDSGGWEILPVYLRDLVPDGIVDGAHRLSEALTRLGLTTSRSPAWLLVADYR